MDYFISIAILILVLSPMLVPLVITGFHTIADRRRKTAPTPLSDRRAPVPA